MAEEIENEVRQPSDVAPEETSPPRTETETPSADGQAAETDSIKPHPLEPEGDRFKQVYARAKEAERLHAEEREKRARLEGELEAMRKVREHEPPKPKEPEYTWAQLQTAIDEGKITLATAMEYREKQLRESLQREHDHKLQTMLDSSKATNTVETDLNKYKQALPDVMVAGSGSRQKLEREFKYLVSLGYNANDPKTELLAARTAFGDPDTLSKKLADTKKAGERDTMKETVTTGKPASTKKDPVLNLSSTQKAHYERLIARGVYAKGWEDVREELAWEKPR